MPWLEQALDRLTARPVCGYYPDAPAAAEPTALAAMALLAHSRPDAANQGLKWLAELQSPDGSVGVDAAHAVPCWPTGWAILAWRTAMRGPRRASGKPEPATAADSAHASPWSAPAERALARLLAIRGTAEKVTEMIGHDSTLQAWPWIEGTHSWVEPTAIGLLALRVSGHATHARSREATRLLLDRMLPSGGWNQGNKIVLNRALHPQIEPTGLALAAMQGETEAAESIGLSIGYLKKAIAGSTATASLSYALIGLAAQNRPPDEADCWLASACENTLRRDRSPYRLALAALAALGSNGPWFVPSANNDPKV